MDGGSSRACVAALVLAGLFSLGYAVGGLADVDTDEPSSAADHAVVLAFSAALVASGVAVALLRSAGAGRASRVAMAVAAMGAVVAGIANGVEDGIGVDDFGLLFALGGLAFFLGLVVAGAVMLARPSPGRPVAPALVLAAVGVVIGETPGFVIVGVTWLALAGALVARAGPFAAPPVR